MKIYTLKYKQSTLDLYDAHKIIMKNMYDDYGDTFLKDGNNYVGMKLTPTGLLPVFKHH